METNVTDEPSPTGPQPRVVILVAVLVIFAIILGMKIAGLTEAPGGGAANTPATSVKPSENRSDAVAAYDAAIATGKPVYVLFHSLTCASCIEISAVVDEVVPAYAEKVAYVNVITDDPSGQALAARFSFQYIPTSFFLEPGGSVADSFTGVLSAEEMRGRLDALVAE